MRRDSLINPFDVSQERQERPERPQLIERKAGRGARATPICGGCNSDDIICHATAQWSNEAQEWQLASTFGQPAHCNSCNSACNLVWLMLN